MQIEARNDRGDIEVLGPSRGLAELFRFLTCNWKHEIATILQLQAVEGCLDRLLDVNVLRFRQHCVILDNDQVDVGLATIIVIVGLIVVAADALVL